MLISVKTRKPGSLFDMNAGLIHSEERESVAMIFLLLQSQKSSRGDVVPMIEDCFVKQVFEVVEW